MDILLSILAGGVTGIAGTIVSAVSGYLERRQRHRQELELRRTDLELARAEAASAERVAAIESESRETEGGWRALEASYQVAGARWSSGDSPWLVAVDVVRGLIRPVLTLGFLILAGAIYFTAVAIPPADVGVRVVDTILYLATTTTLWWFGTRPRRAER